MGVARDEYGAISDSMAPLAGTTQKMDAKCAEFKV